METPHHSVQRRRSRWFGAARRDDGQAVFEFVLILPIFMLFVLLMIDFAILGYSYVSVANAAREGARFGSVNCVSDCSTGDVEARVLARSSGILTDSGDVTVSWPDGTDRGDPVAVSVNHAHGLLFFPFTIPVVSCSEMRLEQRDATAPGGGSGC